MMSVSDLAEPSPFVLYPLSRAMEKLMRLFFMPTPLLPPKHRLGYRWEQTAACSAEHLVRLLPCTNEPYLSIERMTPKGRVLSSLRMQDEYREQGLRAGEKMN